MVDRRWLFICSCIALVTSAFTFVVRGDVLQSLGNAFELTQEQKGSIEGAVFFGMALSMVGGGFVCDALGMKNILFLAFIAHLVGSLGTIFAPHTSWSYHWLYYASILMGFGNGLTEVAVNPLVATLYAKEKTHYLNMLHAWWPGGLVIGGLMAQVVMRTYFPEGVGGLALWQSSLMLIVIPACIYGAMLLPAAFPATERVESGVTMGDMFKDCIRPLFIIWGVCMLMTAATELGPQKWQESVMRSTAGISGTLILVYTSGMMFVLRHFAGPIAHAISPVGMMMGSAALSAVGLYMLSFANDMTTALLYATIYGLGIAFFWPTMLGVTAERFPKGGALALALMGSIGNLSISQVLPMMGGIVDTTSTAELRTLDGELRTVAAADTPPAGADATIAPIDSRLIGLKMTPTDWKLAYDDKALADSIAKAEFSKANGRAQTIASGVQAGVRPSTPGIAEEDVLALAFRDQIAQAYVDPAWAKAYVDSGAAPPADSVGAKLVDASKVKGEALAFDQIRQVAAGAALDAGKMGAIFAQATDALIALDKADAAVAKSLLTSDEVRAKLDKAISTAEEAAKLPPEVEPAGSAVVAERTEAQKKDDRIREEAVKARGDLEEALKTRTAFDAAKLNELATANAGVQLVKLRLAKYRIVASAEATGFKEAFRTVSVLPCVLVVIFTLIFLYDLSRGGYKPEILISQREENELMSGGVQAAVE